MRRVVAKSAAHGRNKLTDSSAGTNLFQLRAGPRNVARRVLLSRSRAEGPRRRRPGLSDGVGSPPRSVLAPSGIGRFVLFGGGPLMSAHSCCGAAAKGSGREVNSPRATDGDPNPLGFARRCLDIAGWMFPGAILMLLPKCPRLPGGLRRDWNRSRTFHVNRNAPADLACDSVRGVAVIPCGKRCAPLSIEGAGFARRPGFGYIRESRNQLNNRSRLSSRLPRDLIHCQE